MAADNHLEKAETMRAEDMRDLADEKRRNRTPVLSEWLLKMEESCNGKSA